MPGNRFFEKTIRERRACKSATFSHRRLRSAILRRWVCSHRSGRSTGCRPQLRLRGEQPEIRRTVEEKPTRVIDQKDSPGAHGQLALLPCRPRARPIRSRRAKNLQSPVAIVLFPVVPNRRRPARAAAVQSVESTTKSRKSEAAGEKDPIHLAEGDRRNSSANRRGPFVYPRTGSSEMSRGDCKSATPRQRRDKPKTVRWPDGFDDPTSDRSLLRPGSADNLVIPIAMKRPRPCARDGSVHHRTEAALFQDSAHVHVNQEQSDRYQRCARVN